MLSKNQLEKYLDSGGNFCPYCNSRNLDGGITEYKHDGPTQPIECLNCKKQWTDILGPIGVIEDNEIDAEVS